MKCVGNSYSRSLFEIVRQEIDYDGKGQMSAALVIYIRLLSYE